jgi:hypothetical protein
MREVEAGFICGFALSIIATPPFAIWVLSVREHMPFVRNVVPEGMPVTLLSVPIASFFFLLWTALGIVFGLALFALNNSHVTGGLGSPNSRYTIIVIISCIIIFFPFFVLSRSARRFFVFLAVSYIILYGWMTPILAVHLPNHTHS